MEFPDSYDNLKFAETLSFLVNRYILRFDDIIPIQEIAGLRNRDNLIIRRHRNGVEIDFRTNDISDTMSSIGKYSSLVSLTVVRETKPNRGNRNSGRFSASQELIRGFAYIYEERFWEAHAVFESIWMNEFGEIRESLWAIIHFCASMVKFQMNNDEVGLKMYEDGMKRISGMGILKEFKDSLPERCSYPIFPDLPIALLDVLRNS